MKIDINKYRHAEVWIKRILDEKVESVGKENVNWGREISEISATSQIPVIAVLQFVGEMFGFTPEMTENKEKIIKFYKYTKIIGIDND